MNGGNTMKKLLTIVMVFAGFFLIAACGDSPSDPPIWWPPPIVNTPDDDPPVDPPVDPPAGNLNTVGFSCASVDNDQTCSGIEDEPGVWNSGPVLRSGDSSVFDYINIEVLNDEDAAVSVFVYATMDVLGCPTTPHTWYTVDLAPDENVAFTFLTQNYRCGDLGDQEMEIMLYNAAGFDPTNMNPINYPHTDLIANAVVRWDNRLIGDMP
jgi:hypothetical protein